MSEEQGPIRMVEIGVVRSTNGKFAAALRFESGKQIHGAWRDTEQEAERESMWLAEGMTKALREDGARVTVMPSSSTVQ